MRTLLVISVVAFLNASINVNAQSRVNATIPEFSFKTDKLSNATGWKLNKSTDQWIENKNVIDDRKCSGSSVSHRAQNFNWLQVAKMTVAGDDFYVFLYEKNSGAYRYPSIYEDWEIDLKTYYFVMNPRQFSDLKSQIEKQSGETFKVKSSVKGSMSDEYKSLGGEHLYNDANLATQVKKSIERNSAYFEECFYFNSQITDGQEIVRFLLPQSCSISENLESEYFEVLTSDFNEFLTSDFSSDFEEENDTGVNNGVSENHSSEECDDATPFMVVENMPAIGDCSSMSGDERHQCTQMEIIRYCSKNTKYPPVAKAAGIQGTVFVYFVVCSDGYVKDVRVLRSVEESLDEEALRVISALPKFEPGTQRGTKVSVQYTVPVKFIIR